MYILGVEVATAYSHGADASPHVISLAGLSHPQSLASFLKHSAFPFHKSWGLDIQSSYCHFKSLPNPPESSGLPRWRFFIHLFLSLTCFTLHLPHVRNRASCYQSSLSWCTWICYNRATCPRPECTDLLNVTGYCLLVVPMKQGVTSYIKNYKWLLVIAMILVIRINYFRVVEWGNSLCSL